MTLVVTFGCNFWVELGTGIGDRDCRSELGIRFGNWGLGLGIRIGNLDWDWDHESELGIGISD